MRSLTLGHLQGVFLRITSSLAAPVPGKAGVGFTSPGEARPLVGARPDLGPRLCPGEAPHMPKLPALHSVLLHVTPLVREKCLQLLPLQNILRSGAAITSWCLLREALCLVLVGNIVLRSVGLALG